jgi:hypothetical protein
MGLRGGGRLRRVRLEPEAGGEGKRAAPAYPWMVRAAAVFKNAHISFLPGGERTYESVQKMNQLSDLGHTQGKRREKRDDGHFLVSNS